jgi:hypothetical protein
MLLPARVRLAVILSATFVACASPRSPTAPLRAPTSAPAPTPVAVDAPPPPILAVGAQAEGLLLARRSTPTAIVRGALRVTEITGLEGAQVVAVEHVDGPRHTWRLHVARPGVDAWLNPEGMLLRAEPSEMAFHTVAPSRVPLLFVRYSDPHELPSVRAVAVRAEAPYVFEERLGATFDGVASLAEVPTRVPVTNNLTAEALATRSALSVGASLAEATDAMLLSRLAADLQFCTATEGTPAVPQSCRVVRAAQRTPAFVRDTLRHALERFVGSESFEQGPDFVEGFTGNDHRIRLTLSPAGASRRLVRIDETQIEHGE